MAIDANILLQGRGVDLGRALAQGQQLAQNFQSGIDARKAKQDKLEANEFITLSAKFDPANPGAFVDGAIKSGKFDDEDLASMERLRENPEMFAPMLAQANQVAGRGEGTREKFSPTTVTLPNGTTVQNTSTGRKVVTDAAGTELTGQAAAQGIVEAERFKTKEQIKRAGGQAAATATQSRISELKKDFSTRGRDSARSSVKLNQALILAQNSTQGLAGSAKVRLSKIFPGIDVTNEAALDASLTSLALDQLQQFKGPTTDFEFGVTERIGGRLGNSKESNIARINSLERARWFNEREVKQFNQHIRAGADPDAFRFNFNEAVTTKKGIFPLKDLQETAVKENMSIDDVLERLNE